jgi:3-dehydroquinate dehydratase / shikimate dehydrogenase
LLIQVVLAESTKELIRDYLDASPESDLVELRLDHVRDLDLEALLSASGKPRIATCRSRAQGGFFAGTEEERRKVLEEAIRRGVEYVDLEFGTRDTGLLPVSGTSRPILSSHHRGDTPVNLEEIYRSMAAQGGDAILKIVPYADSCSDNLRVRSLLREARSEGRKLIAFCMGEKGKPSRILSLAWGSWAVYAPSTPDSQTAPGQLLLSDLAGLYRHRELEESTPLCGILGHPLSGSLSPLLHNRAYARLGIKRCFLPFETEGVAEFLPLLSELPISGLAVTHPHKETMLSHCDELDPVARRVGAVNTVVRRWNRLVGHNTDVEGGVAPLRRAVPLAGAKVGILGSGGAARALALGLTREGAQVTLFARNRAKAEARARSLECRFESWSRARSFQGQVLINATPVGMHPGPDESPLSWDRIRADVACDLVYSPLATRFLREGVRAGARPLSGIEMFLEQALLQFEILTGERAPRPLFEEILAPRLEEARRPEW